MKNTIIFLSGLGVPKILAKSKFLWNDSFWQENNRIYISSKIPTSDVMVEKELYRLSNIINSFDSPIIMSHSLGSWWAANLACTKANFNKLVMVTPLCDHSEYPIFNVSSYYNPCNRKPNDGFGAKNTLVYVAKYDLLVPPQSHGFLLAKHFNAQIHQLDGGHFYQTNHNEMLKTIKYCFDI